MLRCTLLLLVAVTAGAGSSEHDFSSWKSAHGKRYETVEDEASAEAAFWANDQIITTHNARGLSFTLGHNEYSDLTWEDFKSKHLMATPVPPLANTTLLAARAPTLTAATPSAVDWVARGAVTAVKTQAQCGGCWAFAATGALEGAHAIATGRLISLSEEQLINCDRKDQGCKGGNPATAFAWVAANGGRDNALCTEKAMPYDLGDG